AEPHQIAGQAGKGRAHDVADDDAPDVLPPPGPARLRALATETSGVRVPATRR
ncbi:MAG: hypothetical protein JWN20_2254, partial [Jatrophihabitantaceae bacterium]|nr:hypothetical protein [Jatrophihabitantaceae bacterium]